MSIAPTETWDLASVFPGGPGGDAFLREADALAAALVTLTAVADALPEEPELESLAETLLELHSITERLEQLGTYAVCAAAEDASGKAAVRADTLANDLSNRYGRAWVVPNARLTTCSDFVFAALLGRPELAHMEGMLREKRRLARFRLPEREEALATELARDGVYGWGELYDMDAGALRIPFDRGNGVESLSAGQLAPLLGSDDKTLRDRAEVALEAGWRPLAPRAAKVLTHLTGTRMVLNERRKLHMLDEPCANAKIERSTLDAMIEAARRAQPLMRRYLAAKAKYMGQATLSWADTFAHVGTSGGKVAYGDAQTFIVEQFDAFSPNLAGFARTALSERWIEVEDRPGKRGGGFCADLPLSRQSRIFMTWGASARSVSTLAHELGHAFHNHVLHDVPAAQRRVPMTLAETASTFAELLVREAALAQVTDQGARLRLLDASLADGLAFLSNIPGRFELEQALYRLRAQGPLDPDELEAECVASFSRWYGPTVAKVDPTYWISKAHYYIPSLSFYNFPYTFGYLFSNLVYERFRPLGAAGAPGYEQLLRRTGDAWAEPIARDELGVDLGDPDTWTSALAPVKRDLDAFLAIVEGS
ncbi:MAG: M3 family metallopeptidase [Pseudomonadota bacterium]|nr:M3 family metallopeptidase [Pseudomonadota bacterium]